MRTFIRIILILFISFILYNWQIIRYGISQGYGQVKIIINSEPIDEAIKRSGLSNDTKSKLKLIETIKRFAADSLELITTKNYNKVYLPKNDSIRLYVINASNKLSLKSYNWNYPIIGEASYKGFFDKNLLKREMFLLRTENLDIDVGEVEAWSTLGWFNDPLMGSVLDNDIEEISSVIIHELFHATVYINGDTELNENLAEFVGVQGAKKFLKTLKKHNADNQYFENKEKRNTAFNLFMHHCAIRLNNLYNSDLTDAEKEAKKKKLLFDFCVELYKRNIFGEEKNRLICRRILHSKNAYFTGYLNYYANDNMYLEELETKFNGEIKLFIRDYKNKYKK